MISLCGSPPASFMMAFITGLILAVILVFISHYKVYNSQYYKEEYVYFSVSKKVILYLSFLAINLCILPLLLLICVFLFSNNN
ncbi:hypothetical protein [Flavobacterium hibisci]|uniref:hypothetical protein n=1 Tax=Flavobacterium hibisci TaxID=1914462 RepID=UPI001CC16DFF|nr:hypothetical protein [Flavobacterium hibisci]MBZ4041806.1 hypothetical protein [Flavobacterium hibisci]